MLLSDINVTNKNTESNVNLCCIFQQQYVPDDVAHICDKIARVIESLLRYDRMSPTHPLVVQMHALLEAVLLTRNSRDMATACLGLMNKVGVTWRFKISRITK